MYAVKKTRYAEFNIVYDFAWKASKDIDNFINEVEKILRDSFFELKEKDQIIIQDIAIESNYIKVTVKAPPKLSPSEIASKIKGITGRRIGVKTGINKVWDRGYICFTRGSKDENEIIKYIKGE